uniref:Major facilitator superfamily (MFS) profile domain-containing protein n=1 Tax=Panagrolaimus davidi TaxID=227884 RepID=A0A914Q2Y1_9BILA
MEINSIETIKADPYESLWSDLGLRESLFLVIIAALVPAFGPVQLYNLYSNPIQIRFGFSNSQALWFDTISSLFYTPLSLLLPYFYEKIGRRPIFLLGTFFGVISSMILFLAEILISIHGPSRFTISLNVIFTVFIGLSYAIGVDYFYILLIADLFPTSAKVTATQAVILIHAIASITVNFGYATFQNFFGAYIYFPFIYSQLFCLFYLYRNLPETRQLPVYQNFEQIRSKAVTRASTRQQSVVERPRFLSVQYGSISDNNNLNNDRRKFKDNDFLII